MAELPEYPPLADYKLSLNLISKRELITGEGGRLMFALKNIDNKPIRLVEWYVNEPYNVQVYCQPWFPGMNGPDPNMWIPIRMEIDPKQTGRFPLDLMPNNEVQIEKELPFVDSLVVSPNGERRYFIKAELNLKSVKVESPLAAGRDSFPGDQRKSCHSSVTSTFSASVRPSTEASTTSTREIAEASPGQQPVRQP